MNFSQIALLFLASALWHPQVAPGGGASGENGKTIITFDEIDTKHDMVVADRYLRRFGVTVTDITPGTQVYIVNDKNVYQGRTLRASSGHNVLTQGSSTEPVSFKLTLAEPAKMVQFTRPKLIAGVNGISFPEWSAQAFDGSGKIIGDSVGEPLGRGPTYYHDIPAKTFVFTGPGIKSVSFSSKNHHFAAFSAVVIDDLTLQREDGR
jgi:hypothetical protein